MKNYYVICMTFDGEYQTEPAIFKEIKEAQEYSSNLGSKWYFYPFHFICSGKTVREAGYGLEHLENKRIKTVQKAFKKLDDWSIENDISLNSEEFWMRL